MTEAGEKLYPYCDYNVWLRDCEKEITEPLEGNITGTIPSWVHGTLLRNGPGSTKVGDSRFKHLFDGSALLHRFAIKDGHATYQCRFVRSNTYNKNRAANRILFTEFGTAAVPDPCQTLFERFASVFSIGDTLTDNTMVSVYPFGDEVYSLTEVPIIHRIDPVTLKTMERKVLDAYIVNHTAHPHVMPNGDVYNLGMARSNGKLNHVIVKFPFSEEGDMFEKAHLVCDVPPRWSLHPSYMHSFGITENYFVLIEQSLCMSLFAFLKNQIRKQPLATALQWYPDEETCILLIDRKKLSVKRYRTDTFTFFHMINCYEEDNKLVVDLSSYKDAKLIEALYVEKVEAMQSIKEFASWTRSRPNRIEIPLDAPEMSKVEIKQLADIGFETPKINYEKYNGRPYRFCYGVNYDADVTHPQPVVKIDCKSGDMLTWCDEGWSPGEPIFAAKPDAKDEDEGVLLSAMVRECGPDSPGAHDVALLVLDASNLREIARATFRTPTPAPKSLHGWFLPHKL